MRPPKAPNSSFCVIPWVHAHINPSGQRYLCCTDSTQSAQSTSWRETSLKEWWNSDYLKSIRRKMLAGESLPECRLCEHSASGDPNRISTMREWYLTLFPQTIESAQKHTATDGSTTLQPVDYDYRSKACNLKCRTCGDHSSSAIQAEVLRNEELKTFSPHLQEGSAGETGKAQWDELLAQLESKPVERFYWAGGEPTLNPYHWRALELIISKGKAPGVSLFYNSNFSFKKETLHRWIRLLSQFRLLDIKASLDGTGELGEYIRDGLDYELFKSNLSEMRDFMKTRAESYLFIDVTITSLTLLDIEGLVELSLSTGVPLICKLMLHEPFNSYMSPFFFPRRYQKEQVLSGLDLIDRKIGKNADHARLLASLREHLQLVLDKDRSLSEDMPEWKSIQSRHMKLLDGIRGKHFDELLSRHHPGIGGWLQNYFST